MWAGAVVPARSLRALRYLARNVATMMRSIPALALLYVLAGNTNAQDVAAYVDYLDRFHVFDHGQFKQIEGQRPQAFQVGGDYVAYSSKNSDLRIYRNGQVTTLERTDAVDPTVTDHYLGYVIAGVLKVHDGEQLNTVCYNTGGHIVEDSVVAYFDERNQRLSAWYRGEEIVLEDALAQWPLENWKSGDNLIAYITTFEKKFKIFYDGDVWDVNFMVDADMPYQAGCDLVAFQDVVDLSFDAFYRGKFFDLEPVMPVRFEVGKGIMAYQDVNGALKVFEDGTIYTALDFPPQEWYVKDSLVVIKDQNFLKVFDEGKLHVVERFWPEVWEASWGAIGYVDQVRNVQLWRRSGRTTVTRGEPVQDIQLIRGLLVAYLNVRSVKVGWHGETYTH